MTARCDGCRHWKLREPVPTRLEKWEADTRPERPKGFIGAMRWMWNPGQFREPHPYVDHWDKSMDECRREDNANMGWCRRFPETEATHRAHHCGEFAA